MFCRSKHTPTYQRVILFSAIPSLRSPGCKGVGGALDLALALALAGGGGLGLLALALALALQGASVKRRRGDGLEEQNRRQGD